MSQDIKKIDFSINKSFSTPNCSHLETPLNFPINNDCNKTKLNDIKNTFYSINIPRKLRNVRSKIPEIKELTNQPEKYHLSTLKDISMAFVNNRENSIRISTTEHPTKSINH